MTTQHRAIWADAYHIMDKYENIPPGPYDENRDYWDGMVHDLDDLYSKYRNDPMAYHIGCAIHDCISDVYKTLTMASDGLDADTRQDVSNQLFAQQEAAQKPTEQQMSML